MDQLCQKEKVTRDRIRLVASSAERIRYLVENEMLPNQISQRRRSRNRTRLSACQELLVIKIPRDSQLILDAQYLLDLVRREVAASLDRMLQLYKISLADSPSSQHHSRSKLSGLAKNMAHLEQQQINTMTVQTVEETILINHKLPVLQKAATSAVLQPLTLTTMIDCMMATETALFRSAVAPAQQQAQSTNAMHLNPSPILAPAHPLNSSLP
jgi:hypothetical protein